MLRHKVEAWTAVEPPMKKRFKHITKLDRNLTEAEILRRGAEKIVPELEEALGIAPAKKIPVGAGTKS